MTAARADLFTVLCENSDLGARWIILRQTGNLVE